MLETFKEPNSLEQYLRDNNLSETGFGESLNPPRSARQIASLIKSKCWVGYINGIQCIYNPDTAIELDEENERKIWGQS